MMLFWGFSLGLIFLLYNMGTILEIRSVKQPLTL